MLGLVKLESAPPMPLTLKRKNGLQNARNNPAAKKLKSVASQMGAVDLTDGPNEGGTSAPMATASTSTTAQ